jgi:glycosyltransferase involved in cell wall biosynthesis
MLAPELLPVWGGVGTYIVELLRHLPSNIEIHVVTPLRESMGRESISSKDFNYAEYFGSNIHIHFISKASDTFVYNAKFQLACLKEIPNLVKKEKIDLIHSHTAHMPDLLLQFRELKTPTITTIHTTIRGQRDGTKNSGIRFSGLERSEKMTCLTYPFLGLLEELYFLKKRQYITVSDWMKQQIGHLYPKLVESPISVIHNSVDTGLFYPSDEHPSNVILFTGRLIAAKGIGFIVEAMPRILKEYPDTLFLFAGAGNSKPYQERLKQLSVSNKNYSFLGYIKEANDLIKFYRGSSIYVAPTLYENLPIRVLEAMSCGLPVVASNVCAIPEAIQNGENGFLIKPGSIDQLTNSICCLLGDKQLRLKMGTNARNTVLRSFDWKVNVFQTTNLFNRVLNNPTKKEDTTEFATVAA